MQICVLRGVIAMFSLLGSASTLSASVGSDVSESKPSVSKNKCHVFPAIPGNLASASLSKAMGRSFGFSSWPSKTRFTFFDWESVKVEGKLIEKN